MELTERRPAILHGTAVDPDAVAEFYRRVFPGRAIEQRWRWLYRMAGPDSAFPLVVQDERRIVAHAGGIPFVARFEGHEYRAAWFIDFVVAPGLERQGLGTRLTQAWMDASQLCVTFCNDLSMGVFRRFGWVESFETSFHTIWLKPFDHPRAAPLGRSARSMANRLCRAAAVAWHRRFAGADAVLEPVGNDVVAAMGRSHVDMSAPGVVAPVRSRDYLEWRVALSPNRDRYRLYREGDVLMLLALRRDERSSIDVLWVSDTRARAYRTIRAMLSALALFGMGRDYSTIRYYPPTRALSAYLRSLAPIASHPRFAYWTSDRLLLDRLRQATWDWQLMDSDFEWI